MKFKHHVGEACTRANPMFKDFLSIAERDPSQREGGLAAFNSFASGMEGKLAKPKLQKPLRWL
jgi:hypothetical protein